jgi:hypothetical protein
MEHLQQRRSIFNKISYLVIIFILLAMLSIAAFYKGILFGLQLSPFAWVFVAIEVVIVGYIFTQIMEEEKLEAKPATQ